MKMKSLLKSNRLSRRFITLEGGEGAGKSSLLEKLKNFLVEHGEEVVITREPGGCKLGEMVREWLLRHDSSLKINSRAELLLFLAARAQHVEELILPSLESGKIVICDRYNDSTIAYQGIARGLGEEEVKNLCHFACGQALPGLTLFLDVDPKVGLLRSRGVEKTHSSQGELDRIESETLDFHLKIRQAFIQLCEREPDRIKKINANQPLSEVCKEAIQIVEERIVEQSRIDQSPNPIF
jgi:dTMP kinase